MASQTTNYSLKKPGQNDFYNIEDQNRNMDIIDSKMLEIDTKSTDAKRVVTEHLDDDTKHLLSGEREKWNDAVQITVGLKTVKSNKDSEGIFTTMETRRKSDDTLHQKSVLSGGTSPQYTTRTITTFAADGITVIKTDMYSLSYDEDGDFVSEV